MYFQKLLRQLFNKIAEFRMQAIENSHVVSDI